MPFARTLLAAAAATSLSCANASSPSTPHVEGEADDARPPAPAPTAQPAPSPTAKPTEAQPADGAVWLSFPDLTLHPASKPRAGLYLEGTREAGAFAPTSDVQGEAADAGQPAQRGQPGYLELSTMRFMAAQEARAPVAPYVEGEMTEQGFVPSSRKVVRFAP